MNGPHRPAEDEQHPYLRAIAIGRKLVLSIGGEGLQSAFHFILNLVFIRTLTTYQYGVFAIVLILGGIALTYVNALVSVPATVYIPKARSRAAVAFLDVVFGSEALAVAVLAAVLVTAGLALWLGTLAEAGAAGVFVGAWTLRNHVRVRIFSSERTSIVVIADIVYVVSGLMMIGLWFWLQGSVPQVTAALLLLATASIFATIVAFVLFGRPVRVSFRRSVVRRAWTLRYDVAWSLFGVTSWNVQGQGVMFLTVALVGPAAYAPIAAGLVLFNPIRPVLGALLNILRPVFAGDLAAKRFGQIRLVLFGSAGAAVLLSLLFGAVIWSCWDLITHYVYGAKFAADSMPLIVFFAALSSVIVFSYQVPLALMQAAGRFRTIAVATTLGGVTGLVSILAILTYSTVAYALAGAAAGEAMCSIYLWGAALQTLRNPPTLKGADRGEAQRGCPGEPLLSPLAADKRAAVVGTPPLL